MKEKVRIIIISIMLSIVLATGVLAVGFSPSSLTFNLEQNKEDCKIISLSSDSEIIKVSDKWAENKNIEWKVSLFDKDASYHGISINYDNELLVGEREIEVCLSGSNVGEYHGVLLLTEEQEGSSIIQMGIWLKVIITELPKNPPANQVVSGENSGGGGGGSGGGGGGGILQQTTTNQQTEQTTQNEEQNNQQTEEAEKEENAGITGAAIGGGSKKSEKIIGITLIAIGIIGLFLYGRRKLR